MGSGDLSPPPLAASFSRGGRILRGEQIAKAANLRLPQAITWLQRTPLSSAQPFSFTW